MTCVICRTGTAVPGTATLTLTRGTSTLVFRHVPALVCDNCGEEYVDGTVASRLLELAEEAHRTRLEVSIREYAA